MSLPSTAWLDTDGRHIWWRHKCIDGEHTNMLPYPRWRNVEGKVSPSIVCAVPGCNSHTIPFIGEPPHDWIEREKT